nr:MAG TPA: Putative zinc ribbon domain [Bacteriophage sp.]
MGVRQKKRIRPAIRIFECQECGFRQPATKWRGTSNAGHVKDMYCVRCKKDTKHTQIE